MFEDLTVLTLSGKRYPIKCDLVVLEKAQREFGSLEKFEFGLLTSIPLIEDGEEVIDEKTGKPKGKGKLPNVPLLNKALYWMATEGEEIAADKEKRPLEKIEEKALLRMVDMTPTALANALHDELYRCIVGKKPEATQNPEEETREE